MISKNNIYNICFILIFILLAIINKVSSIPENTEWQANHSSDLRIISATVSEDRLMIGLNIRLHDGSYTYWKNPGDSGVEPSIQILPNPEIIQYNVQWPAPIIIKNQYGTNYAYKDDLVIPIELELTNKGNLLNLDLDVEYGVCREICIPVKDRIEFKIINDIENYISHSNKLLKSVLTDIPKYRLDDEKVIRTTKLLNVNGTNVLSIIFSEQVKGVIIDQSDNFQFFDTGNSLEYYEEYQFTFREIYNGREIKGEKVSALIFLENEYFLEDFIIE